MNALDRFIAAATRSRERIMAREQPVTFARVVTQTPIGDPLAHEVRQAARAAQSARNDDQ